jgi:dimethylaniline monooxygenase (N-oxide forming)
VSHLDWKSTEVVAKPGLVGLEGERVRFADGSAAEADVVVYCTGYKISFPFFDPDFLSAPGNDLPLWLRLVRPGETDIFFVGLLQPLGALMPLAEAQAKLIAAHLAGDYAFPPAGVMQAELERERHAKHAPLRSVAAPHDAGGLRSQFSRAGSRAACWPAQGQGGEGAAELMALGGMFR